MALASIVMLGLMTFYLGSQGTWLDASAQAMTQREATLFLEDIASHVHRAAHAQVGSSQLDLFDGEENSIYAYHWNSSGDHRIYAGVPGHSLQPVTTCRCASFQCDTSYSAVRINVVFLSAQGDSVHASSLLALRNRGES